MSKRTIVKDESYTAHAIDMVSIIIFDSATDCTLTLPSPTGAYGADCDVHNKGAGTVTIGTQTVATGSHAHISNDGGTAWVVVIGGGNLTKEDIETVLTGEISTHTHASLVTKVNVEAVLTGEITTHSHAGSTTHYEPVTNGNVTTPELIFYNGDVVMAIVNN